MLLLSLVVSKENFQQHIGKMMMWIALSTTLCLIISVSGGIYSGLDGDKQGNLFIGSNDFGGKGEDLGVKTILIAVPVVSGGLVSDSGRKGSYFSGVGSLNGGGKGFTGEFAGNLGKEGFGGGFGGSQENRGLGGGFTGNQIKVGFGDGFLGNLGKGNFDGGFRGKFDDTIGFGKKGFNHGFDGGVGKVGFNSGFGTRSFGKGGIDKEDFIGRNTEIARKGGLGSSIENSKGRLIANYGRGSYNSGGYENIGEGNKGDFTLGGPRSVSFFRKGFRNELKADVEKRGSQGGFGEEECDFPETTEGDLGKDESGTGRRGFAKIGFLGGAQKFNKDNGKGTSIRNGRDSDDFQRLVQNGFDEGGHDGRLNGFVLANGKDVFSKVSNERNNGKALYGEIGGGNENARLGISIIKLGEIGAVGEGYGGPRIPFPESAKGVYSLNGAGQLGSSGGFSRTDHEIESPLEFSRNDFGVHKGEYRQGVYSGVKGGK